MDIQSFRRAVTNGQVEWEGHALARMVERGILREDVLAILAEGGCIEEYEDDQPFPSALFLGKVKSRPLHVVAAFDVSATMVFVITTYEPTSEYFESDWKTRRKRL